ncbi:ROK family protein [Albirhodobacter sp. R86504]|uniref:glucokinase n=1 Tax=Albirhodobacter sp. R86504 TaxID=3093848 RepID=UPI00366DAEE2
MTLTKTSFSLLADVGGTNSRLAIARDGVMDQKTIRRYANRGHSGFEAIVTQYLAEEGIAACDDICVAVAGPISNGVARMTNLDWEIKPEALAKASGASRAAVLNDLQAQGQALGHISKNALRLLVDGQTAATDATRLVIGIGTGFNCAPVHETPKLRYVAPSESGHITLPVRDEAMLRLARALAGSDGFASVEDVLSGRGLVHVHTHLHGPTRMKGEDIMEALDQGDSHAKETARLVAKILGVVIGDQALVHLPFGGIYLCGSVARALAPHLVALGFIDAFRDKGRFSEFLGSFPISVIEDDFAALTGCAAYLRALRNA